ncbi:MAG TPA: HAD family phosphatase [Ktedonobacterales bacterium]|nr:HAD family phosphatase [Ktedonobacterales bacterium]
MTIRAVVFDIGGILEVIPEGGDPTRRFPALIARWEQRLGMPPGELASQINAMSARLLAAGKDGGLGTCSEAEWCDALRLATAWDQRQVDAFMRDFWDVYCGDLNTELAAYLAGLRPRYRTALLSNSFVGARREEEERFHFSAIADPIIYSHEEGIEKPDPRIYALTCERLACKPDEIVFLDDAEANVTAAREFGIHAILFRDNAQAMAAINERARSG